MKTLSHSGLLELWERGSGLHPLDRALLALCAALPGESQDTLAKWTVGRRNAALTKLRRACFGDRLTGWVACPHCEERLEFSFDARTLVQQPAPDDCRQMSVGGRRFRALTSRDLASIAGESDERVAAVALARRCILEGEEIDEEISAGDLDAIGEVLGEADPQAETLLDFACAACGHRWQDSLDMAAWLWTEIDARARRLLHDVHRLARAYGWAERDILSLSERRRAAYLEMVQQ